LSRDKEIPNVLFTGQPVAKLIHLGEPAFSCQSFSLST